MGLEKDFFKFIQDRQLIWYKRFILKEKPPWTDDEVLKNYKIINVYRELDKGTIYIINKIKDIKQREIMLLNDIFYRFFNRYNLYENLEIGILNGIDKSLEIKFENLRKQGKPIFSDAYLIASNKNNEPKYLYILEILKNLKLKELIANIDNSADPKSSLKEIQKIKNIGPFLAYEIWTDLTYFNFFKQGWTDNDFVNIGPGAEWGLEIIYDKRLNKKEQLEKIYHLHKIQKELLNNLEWKKIFYKNAFSNRPYLSLRNIEHSLCEFRKYWNLSHGKGKKRKFYYR